MRGHNLYQVSIAQVLIRYELFVRSLLRAENILRPQPCLPQKTLQLGDGKRPFEVVHGLKLHTALSQDTPDLSTCASRRLFVNRDCGNFLHIVTKLLVHLRRLLRNGCGSQQFGVIPLEQGFHLFRSAIGSGMDLLDQLIDPRRHGDEIPHRGRAWIPKRMRRSTTYKKATPRAQFDVLVSIPEAQHAFEDIPGLIIIAMQMNGCDEARGIENASGILPLRENEAAFGRA